VPRHPDPDHERAVDFDLSGRRRSLLRNAQRFGTVAKHLRAAGRPEASLASHAARECRAIAARSWIVADPSAPPRHQ
jgi:hypothetical protein